MTIHRHVKVVEKLKMPCKKMKFIKSQQFLTSNKYTRIIFRIRDYKCVHKKP